MTAEPARGPDDGRDGSSCPVCGGASKVGIRLDRQAAFIRVCPSCGHRFLARAPAAASPSAPARPRAAEPLYGETYAGFREDPFFERRVTEELRLHLAPRLPAGSRVLDVGCGNGAFLEVARAFGYRTVGLDVSASAAERVRQRGIEAHVGRLGEVALGGHFDAVTMWDVVEHLDDPVTVLQTAAGLLREGGWLFAKVPTFGPLNFPLIRAAPRAAGVLLGAPSHVQYFTRATLERCFDRAALRTDALVPVTAMRKARTSGPLLKRVARLAKTTLSRRLENVSYLVAAQP